MKKTIISLFIITLILAGIAGYHHNTQAGMVLIGSRPPAAAGGFAENCDEADGTTMNNFTPNTWTAGGGTPDPVADTAQFQGGSASCYYDTPDASAGSADIDYTMSGGVSQLWVFYVRYTGVATDNDNTQFFALRDSGNNNICIVDANYDTTGTDHIDIRNCGLGGCVETGFTLTDGSWHKIELEWNANGGGNDLCKIDVDDSGTPDQETAKINATPANVLLLNYSDDACEYELWVDEIVGTDGGTI